MIDAILGDLMWAIIVVILMCASVWGGAQWAIKNSPLLYSNGYVDGYQSRIDYEQDMGAGLSP